MATATTTTSRRPDRFIDPATLMQIRSLELRAKSVVQGFQTGLNRSPYHGFSVEFTEYREYSPGDDPRYLDWKLFARSDRYYIKQFEDETNLRCRLLLDLSKSMGFGTIGHTKADYARTLAATLGYFLSLQRDAVGLVVFDEAVDDVIPARFRPGHLHRFLVSLERNVGGQSTNLDLPLRQVAEHVQKRGMFVLMSDLLAPVDRLATNLGYLRSRGHEVLVFQILDPAELSLDFDEPSLFHDVESGREVYIDPKQARESYQKRFTEHTDGIRRTCDQLGITWRQFTTDTPLELALSEFLRSRMREAGGHPSRRSR